MKLVCLFALLCLSGCAGLDAYKAGAVDTLSKANDTALHDAEFVICRGVSIGAWIREYGANAQAAEAWRVLCGSPVTELPAPP